MSCSHNRDAASKRSTSDRGGFCEAITHAINRGDWESLRQLAKPGMRANDYITMWENTRRTGHPIRVGKQVAVEKAAELNGRKCTKYSYALENDDGTVGPHELHILIGQQTGKPELLDFWNFGW